MTAPAQHRSGSLGREVGVVGATMMGLGSILGTGIFVSIAVAAGKAGPAVLLSIVIAALVASCNALSSAQLAANHSVSGGTYEYGYRWLNPTLGFTAGWMFLCAKSASAATAALGFAGYALQMAGTSAPNWLVPLAVGAVAVLTVLVLTGIRRSAWTNSVIVVVTLLALVAFAVAGLPVALGKGADALQPFFAPVTDNSPAARLLEASASPARQLATLPGGLTVRHKVDPNPAGLPGGLFGFPLHAMGSELAAEKSWRNPNTRCRGR